MASTSSGMQTVQSSSSSSTLRPSLTATLAKLRANPDNPRKTEEALVLIRKVFIKEKTGVDRLRRYGGIADVLKVIQSDNKKSVDIALSILGNICIDPKVQAQVIELDGIKSLTKVVETSKATEMVNRACRALANLSQNPAGITGIYDQEGLIFRIVSHLNETQDIYLQLTLLRALRLFSDTTTHRHAVLDEEGLRAVALLLKSKDEAVVKAAYQSMMVLSKEYNEVCSRQIVAADAPAAVIEHTSHSNEEIRKTAFNLLTNQWMTHEEMRVAIGNAGGIPFFIEQICSQKDSRKQLIMANALCLSCFEVVNRVRVKENDGIPLIIKLLKDSEYSRIHNRLISAITCFLYDESAWEILMKNEIVSVVVEHLRKVANLNRICPAETTEPVTVHRLATDKLHRKSESSSKCSPSDGSAEVTNNLASSRESISAEVLYKNNPTKSMTSAIVIEESEKKEALCSKTDDKNTPRYSLDSPTYKSVVDWTVEDYSSGPKNLLDTEYFQCGSPDRYSGYSSLSNSGPYSPLSAASSANFSPDASPITHALSPMSSPDRTSPLQDNCSAGSSSSARVSQSPIWSPVHSSAWDDPVPSPPLFGQESVDTTSEPASPVLLAGGDCPQFVDDTLHFSSSDDDDDDFKVVSDGEDHTGDQVHKPSPSLSERRSAQVHVKIKEHQQLNSDTSDSDLTSESKPKQKRTPLSSKRGLKRKLDLTPERRKKILRNVEKSNSGASPTMDLVKILSSSLLSKADEKVKQEYPTSKRDYHRHTEYCLVMLLKKISCDADPSEHLIRQNVLSTLMDYVVHASKPFAKCARILIRLAKNTACFEAIILELVPQLITSKLSCKTAKLTGAAAKKRETTETKGPVSVRSDPVRDGIHRSMSACSLKETTKVMQFHQQVSRKRQDGEDKVDVDKHEEAQQLKTTLLSSLAFMAETPFGQGIIEHLLLTGTSNEKCKTAVSLSLICRSRSLLAKIYSDLDGFGYLLAAMKQKDKDLRQHAFTGLCTLLEFSNIKQPSSPAKKLGTRESSSPGTPEPQPPSASSKTKSGGDVLFRMDDGSEVVACRSTLSQHSEVFMAMLQGHYSESGQPEVKMPGVSRAAFEIVIDHLQLDPPKLPESFRGCHDVDIALEAHSLAHRFLLDELLQSLSAAIIKEFLDGRTVRKIFSHAVLHEAQHMKRQCIGFLLSNDMEDAASLFFQIISSSEGTVLCDVIEALFLN